MAYFRVLQCSLMQANFGSANSSVTSGPKHTALLQRGLTSFLT